MFTIEVKKRGKDEEFDFEDVKETISVFHDDCFGGKVIWEEKHFAYYKQSEYSREPYKVEYKYLSFTCKRCSSSDSMKIEIENNLKIIQTAIDGEERKITDEIRVIQKK